VKWQTKRGNMLNVLLGNFRETLHRYSNIFVAVALGLSGVMPIILEGTVSADQLTNRNVTISTSQPDATGVSYTFSFGTAGTATTIQSMVFTFCTTALGPCTLPGGASAGDKLNVSHVAAAPGAFTGSSNGAFAEYSGADAGGCTTSDGGAGVATQYCVTRTDATSETNGTKTFVVSGIHNPTIPTGNNVSIYVRIALYSDTAFATQVHEGTVATSIVNRLSVSGRVQERLVFCVFALDDAAGSSGTVGSAATNMPQDCGAAEATASTSVDIGVVDNTQITRSPVDNDPGNSLIGNDRFGAAMVTTNAANGVALTYYADAASGTQETRAFRVPGATCDVSGTSIADQCFISADDTTGETFTPGTERFGMQIACVVNSTTTASAIGTTSNLGKDGTGTYVNGNGTSGSYNAVYNAGRTTGIDDVSATDNCENNPGAILNDKYGWRDSDTAQPLISSVTVVDDEMVKFRIGATANPTTPSGTYTVAAVYVATPSF
jgi:hypothetical protein